MFKIIEPKDYSYYRARIDILIGLMKLNQEFSLSFEEQASSTFIISEDEGAIYGGAILQKQHIKNLPLQLKASLSGFVLNVEYVWVCTLILCHGAAKGASENTCEFNFSEAFYTHLLKKLNEFGKKRNISFLCLTLNPLEHLKLKDNEDWSCVLGVDPTKSLDGLFHGVLPLSQQKYKSSTCRLQHQRPTRPFKFLCKNSSLPTSVSFKEKTLLENFRQAIVLKGLSYLTANFSWLKS